MRLLTTHWTLDSGEWRSELREIFQLWSQWSITTFLRHLPVYSPHSPHTRLSVIKKINKQKLVLTKSCNCCSFNLLSGICNALIKLNFQSATSQNRHRHLDFWSYDPIAPAVPPFAHSSSELFPSYHDRHLATAGPVTAHRPGPGVCMTLSLQQTRFSFECWVVGCWLPTKKK